MSRKKKNLSSQEMKEEKTIISFFFHFFNYFASVLSENGVPEADILALGGWETDYVMKNVYRHSMMSKDEKKKRDAMSQLKGSLF